MRHVVRHYRLEFIVPISRVVHKGKDGSHLVAEKTGKCGISCIPSVQRVEVGDHLILGQKRSDK